MFYTTQHALQNENCQKVGFISLSYNVGGFPEGGYDYEIPLQMSQVGKALPIRLCGIYLCFDSSLWKPVADLVSHVLSPRCASAYAASKVRIKNVCTNCTRWGFR